MECSKGPAVFLDHARAMDYARKWHGIIEPMFTFPDGTEIRYAEDVYTAVKEDFSEKEVEANQDV